LHQSLALATETPVYDSGEVLASFWRHIRRLTAESARCLTSVKRQSFVWYACRKLWLLSARHINAARFVYSSGRCTLWRNNRPNGVTCATIGVAHTSHDSRRSPTYDSADDRTIASA